jgi:alpha-L-rhamnosidase
LSENGRNDIAYTLVNQKDYPSWLYPITKGATTIWEHWDGIKPDGSFWSADMNSFNHYAYGSVGDWLYRVMAGIDTDSEKPGYKHIYIKPQPEHDISFARASLESMYGEIKSAWEKKDGRMTVEATIPANTTATVILPSAKLENVKEGGQPVSEADGVSDYKQVGRGVCLELGSGAYRFEYNI